MNANVSCITRRRFTVTVGGAAAAWPLPALSQRMRRIGVLMPLAADDPEAQNRVAGFLQGLQELGWAVGRNVRIDMRSSIVDRDRFRTFAAELVALAPDVLVTSGPAVQSIRQATHTIPVVFAGLNDPVGGGFVANLARPGGNITGFAGMEYGSSGKWLELLKQIAPNVSRVAVIRDPGGPGGFGQFGAIQSAAPSLGMEVSPIDVEGAGMLPARAAGEVEQGITAFARQPNGGIVVTAAGAAVRDRDLIIALAARYRLPAVYFTRLFVAAGGLISYGAVTTDIWRQAAGYVDRILKGEKPADLPVQAPTRYEIVINTKTAKRLGLDVPPQLLARADEVIE
jgi:putative ABC transport system substrate-binding protein